MSLFNLFKKRNSFDNFILEKKTYSAISLAPFTKNFPQYSDFEYEKNMKIWDSIIPLALIGYDAFNEGLINDANKINDLIKDVNKQFPKGSDLLLKDYFDFIKNKNIDEVSQFSAFWVSKNLKLYVSQNLKSIIEQKEFLNIFSTFFKLSFNNTAFNFSKFIEKNYNGNMKSREGMIEYVSLTENFINNIFSEIKEKK
ncbi:hypothetical protein [Cloacibacterium normanense]|jgi:hypothetical protein|uniref:hypothetical protein n=1 Tax=Cloacibacterium normanense TaxID=237258 RepID=UPI00391A8F16